MGPFDSYPTWLRENPRCLGGGSCRTGYGLLLQRITKQTKCAYCGLDMANSYEHWLHMSLDHVIPGYMADREGWRSWVDNANNLVLCCSACNAFLNGFRIATDAAAPTNFEEFERLRDSVFTQKKEQALRRHEHERRLFESRPWEQEVDPSTLPRWP